LNQGATPKTCTDANIAKETWNRLARQNAMYFIASNRSDWTEDDFFETGRQAASRMLEQMQPRTGPGTSMCDVGCGVGRLALAFAPYFERVVGLDVSPEMIERAVRFQKEHGVTNTQFFVSNGADLQEIPDSSQDLVVSHLVFLHLTSRQLIKCYLREFSRVMKTGALAFFDLSVVPESVKGKVLYSMKEMRDPVYRELYLFFGPSLGTHSPAVRGKRVTAHWLKTALEEANLDLVSINLPDNWTESALTQVICRKL
jgi:ubiquinone/menaquinone biosynthesis C-methylase UbiE